MSYPLTLLPRACANAKKDKTYDDFCKSPYYNAFVKFGSFINNVRPLYPERYVDHVVTSGVKLDHWCKEELYEQYATNLIKKENVETALERSIMTMTGHKTTQMVRRYIREANIFKNNALNKIKI